MGWFVLIIVGQRFKTHNGTSAPATSLASISSAEDRSNTNNFQFPNNWDSHSVNGEWDTASEAEKETLVAAFSKASVNQHTAAFFYTNLNDVYGDSTNPNYDVYLLNMFLGLDKISPAQSYPTFQGYVWKRIDAARTPQGKVEVIDVFWPDGHSFIHYQKFGSDSIDIGADGPWTGDLATYACRTTVSGNKYTILATAPETWTSTGTFQVSTDGNELDMTLPGQIPIRYTLVARLAKNIDDAHQ